MTLTRPKLTGLLLAVLFLFQASVFWPITMEFFTPDGIFYLARQVDNWDDLKSVFTNLDDVSNYRPLTYLVATRLSLWWTLNPYPYHVFTLLFHVGITALVFWLARLLLHSDVAAFAAAVFFGLHSAASRVAFGITFISDLLYGTFFIFAIIAFVKFERGFGNRWHVLSLLSFVLSLLSKEPAVTLPAVLTAALVLVPGISTQPDGGPLRLRQALKRTQPFWIVSLLYLGWFAFLTCGWFLPQDPNHPYHVSLSLENFLSKHRYLELAFNLGPFNTVAGHPTIAGFTTRLFPPGLAEFFKETCDFLLYLMGPVWTLWLWIRGDWQSLSKVVVNALATPLVVISLLVFVRSLFRHSRNNDNKTALYGFLFFIFVLSPVLMLPADKTMLHNLYVPVAGLGIAVGEFVRVRLHRDKGRFNKFVALAIPAIFVAAGIHYISFSLKEGWPTTSSRLAKKYLEDVQRLHPELPKGAVLYFERTGNRAWPYLTAGGDVFRVFYGDENLVTIFGDYEQQVSTTARPSSTVLRFRESNGKLILSKN